MTRRHSLQAAHRAGARGFARAKLRTRRRATESSTPSMVAFSLGRARSLAQSGGPVDPEVAAVGHIGRLVGVVFDAAAHDVILVGFRDTAAPMQLDDLAVAMRAAARNEWPLVSIDPMPETPVTGLQRVRMEGGVEDTPFGHDLLALDVWLKRSALGTVDTSLVSYFDLRATIVGRDAGAVEGASRMWFLCSTGVSKNVRASSRSMRCVSEC